MPLPTKGKFCKWCWKTLEKSNAASTTIQGSNMEAPPTQCKQMVNQPWSKKDQQGLNLQHTWFRESPADRVATPCTLGAECTFIQHHTALYWFGQSAFVAIFWNSLQISPYTCRRIEVPSCACPVWPEFPHGGSEAPKPLPSPQALEAVLSLSLSSLILFTKDLLLHSGNKTRISSTEKTTSAAQRAQGPASRLT